MRITNSMTTNKMLLNLNRNANKVDNLYNQQISGKKIQLASDNPIIASRALKFRTNISETEQYARNVAQGLSWMEISEQGFTNMLDILRDISGKCVQGANDPFAPTDRQKIATEISALYAQIGSEMNISYAGRYVFSGYRTDEPPTFEENNLLEYDITQAFATVDIDKTKAYYRGGMDAAPEVHEVYRLKLPYSDAAMLGSPPVLTAKDAAGVTTTYTIVTTAVNPDGTPNASSYTPGANDINFIPSTGELILGANVAQALATTGAGGISVDYHKAGFNKGELNPKVYFTCTDTLAVPPMTYTMEHQELQFEFGVNTRITINNQAKDVFTPQLYADLKEFVELVAGVQLSTDAALTAKYEGFPYNLSGEALQNAIAEQKNEEEQKYRGILQDRYSNIIEQLSRHSATANTEYTNLGSRMNRLDLIRTRLEEDRVSYTKLMSDNENVNYLEVMMELSAAESVYQAALKAGASIMQLSLADFIR